MSTKKCPECGARMKPPPLPPYRLTWGQIIVTVLLTLLAMGVWILSALWVD